MEILSKLDGYKTYLGAIGFALIAGYYFLQGDTVHAMEFLTAALALFGLRQAIQKPVEVKEKKAEEKPAS